MRPDQYFDWADASEFTDIDLSKYETRSTTQGILVRCEYVRDVSTWTPRPVPDANYFPPVKPTRKAVTGQHPGQPNYWESVTVYNDAMRQTEYRQNEDGYWIAPVHAGLPHTSGGVYKLVVSNCTAKLHFVDLDADGNRPPSQTFDEGVHELTFDESIATVGIQTQDSHRNSSIKLLYPGGDSELFHPAYRKSLKQYGILRNLGFNKTNRARETKWNERVSPDGSQFSRKHDGYEPGACYEDFIELGNVCEADPWITVPHGVDNNYVHQLMKLVDSQSNRETIYFELSNEVWLASFKEQHSYALQMAEELTLTGVDQVKRARWVIIRLAQLARVAREATSKNVVVVFAWQATSVRDVPAALAASLPSDLAEIDAFAFAPYLSMNWSKGNTVTAVLDYLEGEMFEKAMQWARNYKAYAETYGKRAVCYEAGQHVVNYRDEDVVQKVQRDPRMRQLYLNYNRQLTSILGDAIVHLSHIQKPKGTAFGSMEFLGDNSPKYSALQEITAKDPINQP